MALLVSACAELPSGADGKLVNEWPGIADPAGWTPEAGNCHDEFQNFPSRTNYRPMDCSKLHRYEFVHVGQFTGADANLANSPDAGTPAYRKAWAECDAKTTEFLGGPWRDRKITIKVGFPTGEAWGGGAHWFLCWVAQLPQLNRAPIFASGSLKGKFADPNLEYGCYQLTTADDKVTDFTSTACTAPHNAEFVGGVDWNVEWSVVTAEAEKEASKQHSICVNAVQGFVGASVNTGTWTWTPGEADWKAGDHFLRCYLYTGKISLKRSMKGVGAKGWLK
ncbi:hypothetical protein Rhe02_56670 [Rhizocola hellebori]|uniref:Septum formation-related domain-containing protein n=1 Tax=Rhizocola hellebori TaxID=1392758 RepID=A0A8J3VIH2_9ACTN|nr:hypothetical protein Rhe02_56670 [Rhizocola hellebori]